MDAAPLFVLLNLLKRTVHVHGPEIGGQDQRLQISVFLPHSLPQP